MTAAQPPARRGLLEQFGALSAGGKTGVVLVVVVVISVITGSISSVMHSQSFAEQLRRQTARQVEPSAPAPLDTIKGPVFYLDLKPVANQQMTDALGEQGHSLRAVPQRRGDFGGVPFQVGTGYVRLRGKNRPELPDAVNNIHVGLKLDKLHVLHGTEVETVGAANVRSQVPEGTEIGRYRVRYADEKEQLIPVVYGRDVRDVWNKDGSRPVHRGKLVWSGTEEAGAREGVTMRLYLLSWANPRADVEVKQINFESVGESAASPFCVALTAERTTP
jgi:hypothetical protein